MSVIRNIFTSSVFRFSVGYVTVLSGVAFLLLVLVYAMFAYRYLAEVGAAILDELERVENQYHAQGAPGVQSLVETREGQRDFDRFYYIAVDAQGRKLAGNLNAWPNFKAYSDGWLSFSGDLLALGGQGRYEFLARSVQMRNGDTLLVARNYNDIIGQIKLVAEALFRSMLVTILLGVLGAVYLSSSVLGRVENINKSVRRIMAGDLSERLPTDQRYADLDQLTLNLNHMLMRIQDLMEGMRQVTDNVAHDLRTPLTRLRNHLAELQRNPGEVGQRVPQLLEEADGLLATFSALLRIAQIESGQQSSVFRALDASVVANDVIDLYEPLAADKQIQTRVDIRQVPPMQGDRDLLFQAFANLVDNAIKYTPEGGDIRIALEHEQDWLVFTVADSGIGIPEHERDKVVRRFYRVESSRSMQPGNGLGLSLVAAVVKLHQGELLLEDNAPGLRVRLLLPLQPASGE